MEAVPILIVIFFFVLVISRLQNQSKERQARLRILEQGLRDPGNDNATRQELIRRLGKGESVGGVWRDWFRHNLTPRRVFGTVAWGLLVGGVLTMIFGDRWDFQAGAAVAGVGFAVLALPHVIRELDSRSTQPRS